LGWVGGWEYEREEEEEEEEEAKRQLQERVIIWKTGVELAREESERRAAEKHQTRRE